MIIEFFPLGIKMTGFCELLFLISSFSPKSGHVLVPESPGDTTVATGVHQDVTHHNMSHTYGQISYCPSFEIIRGHKSLTEMGADLYPEARALKTQSAKKYYIYVYIPRVPLLLPLFIVLSHFYVKKEKVHWQLLSPLNKTPILHF